MQENFSSSAEQRNSSSPEQEAAMLARLVEACADEEANLRDCLISAASRVDSGCRPQAYLITNRNCQACEESKEELRGHLKTGAVKELDSADPLAERLLNGMEIDSVPALVLADCKGEVLAQLQIFPE